MAANAQNPTINWSAPNLTEEWKRFQQHSELMFVGPLKKTTNEERAAYILIWVGIEGREIFNSWNLTPEQGQDYAFLFTQFRKHTEPQKNTLFSRYIFQTRRQKDDESFVAFATDLRNLAKECSYDKPEEMVRDRIVAGINNEDVREKLLTEGDSLTMTKAIQIATTHETTQAQLKSMAGSSMTSKHQQAEVDAIKKKTYRQNKDRETFTCKNCGGKHEKRQCPAFGKKCNFCHKLNHYEKQCFAKKKGDRPNRPQKSVHTLEEEDEFYISSIEQEKEKNTAFANIELTDTTEGNTATCNIRFKIDTGAQANVLPLKVFNKKINKPNLLEPSSHKLISYTGQQLKTTGKVKLQCKYKDRQDDLTFHVVDTEAQPILGLQACIDLQLVKLLLSIEEKTEKETMTTDSVKQEYQQLFKGMGDIGGEARIQLRPDAVPVIDAPRRVPIALRDRLRQELDRMCEQNIIEKVTEPTDWVNSLVVVEKPNGKLRVCLDPRNLNKAIKRPHYSMPTLEDAVSKMADAKFFSKLDAQSGYWQIKLDEESSYLTTFNSPFGRYRFKRLPFGIISSQDLFQQKMDEIFEGLPGVTPPIDDVIIHGSTRKEHDDRLRAALDRSTEKQLRLNGEKLTVGATEVEYFGHMITDQGLKPDPKKIKAIESMPPPTTKKELQTVLGMITYLAKFAPQLSEITKPMRDLLGEDIEFIWDAAQEESLKKVKKIITDEPVLAFFDPNKPIVLQVDASKHGLGATLMQDKKPVGYASKSLNATEQNYAQIEKELYAILFGCRRFHQFVYGQQVTVESDHKPLESIATKALAAAPPRLQRMLLQLQKYDIKIVHVPGKKIPVADTLSRQVIIEDDSGCEEFKDIEAQVHCITTSLPINDSKMEEVRQATADDQQLRRLKQVILDGWPANRQNCDKHLLEFWNFRDELTEIDGIIFKGTKIFIPQALRQMMLDKLHVDHLGEEKTQQRARGIFFWPGMTNDIKQKIATCQICATHRSSNQKEPMLSHELPTRPWQKVATDLFSWEGRQFLVTVDYYSRFFEIDELNTTTSSAVIRKLSTHFARYGIPEALISDNGPQFSSDEFTRFAKSWDFIHTTSSPGYPQSNGLAERTVQTAKKLLTKAKEDGTQPLLALLEYRNTPVDNHASPATLLMSRQLRSVLPVTQEHLRPQQVKPSVFISKREKIQARQKYYFDQGSKALSPLKAKDSVYLQVDDKWKPAEVVEVEKEPRSYTVQTTDGGMYRRNRKFLRSNPEPQVRDEPEPEPQPKKVVQDSEVKQETTTRSGRVVRPPTRVDL